MKPYINDIVVVEGKADASLMTSLFEVEVVTLNGYEMNKLELDYLKRASELYKILLLTDPDEAGEFIRKKLHQTDINFIDIYVELEKCNKNGKHGVAECEIEEIKAVFEPFCSKNVEILKEIALIDIVELLPTKKNRRMVCEKLKLGQCNNKKMVNRLNRLKYSRIQLEKEI